MAKENSKGKTSKRGKKSSVKSATITADLRVWWLHGSDALLLQERTAELSRALEERFGGIETFRFDGEMAEVAVVLDELRSYGLMQRHKFVIVDQADQFLKTSDEDSGGRVDRRAIVERYVNSPVDDATLLLRSTTFHSQGRIEKSLIKAGGVVVCDHPEIEEAIAWCIDRCRTRWKKTLNREAADLLVDRLGTSLARLDSEIGKIVNYIGDRNTIAETDVRELVGPSREEQVWELQGAIMTGNAGTAVEKLRELMEISRQPEELVRWSIGDLFRKLYQVSLARDQGIGEWDIIRQFKLFGAQKNQYLSVGKRDNIDLFARLFRSALSEDRRVKQGLADPVRSLEATTITVTDSIGRSCRR